MLFSEIGTTVLFEQGTVDTYVHDTTVFCVQNFVVRIDNKKISTALNRLSERQRNFVLLYYFCDMNDREISELYHISRSAVGYSRNRALRRLEEMIKERN